MGLATVAMLQLGCLVAPPGPIEIFTGLDDTMALAIERTYVTSVGPGSQCVDCFVIPHKVERFESVQVSPAEALDVTEGRDGVLRLTPDRTADIDLSVLARMAPRGDLESAHAFIAARRPHHIAAEFLRCPHAGEFRSDDADTLFVAPGGVNVLVVEAQSFDGRRVVGAQGFAEMLGPNGRSTLDDTGSPWRDLRLEPAERVGATTLFLPGFDDGDALALEVIGLDDVETAVAIEDRPRTSRGGPAPLHPLNLDLAFRGQPLCNFPLARWQVAAPVACAARTAGENDGQRDLRFGVHFVRVDDADCIVDVVLPLDETELHAKVLLTESQQVVLETSKHPLE